MPAGHSLDRSSSEDSGLAASPHLDGMLLREAPVTVEKIQGITNSMLASPAIFQSKSIILTNKIKQKCEVFESLIFFAIELEVMLMNLHIFPLFFPCL